MLKFIIPSLLDFRLKSKCNCQCSNILYLYEKVCETALILITFPVVVAVAMFVISINNFSDKEDTIQTIISTDIPKYWECLSFATRFSNDDMWKMCPISKEKIICTSNFVDNAKNNIKYEIVIESVQFLYKCEIHLMKLSTWNW